MMMLVTPITAKADWDNPTINGVPMSDEAKVFCEGGVDLDTFNGNMDANFVVQMSDLQKVTLGGNGDDIIITSHKVMCVDTIVYDITPKEEHPNLSYDIVDDIWVDNHVVTLELWAKGFVDRITVFWGDRHRTEMTRDEGDGNTWSFMHEYTRVETDYSIRVKIEDKKGNTKNYTFQDDEFLQIYVPE